MQESKTIARAAALAIAMSAVAISCLPFDTTCFGLCRGCGIAARLLYSFCHTGLIHCIFNVWCLLLVVFTYPMTIWRLLTAYIVAATVPIYVFPATFFVLPTIGLSAVVYVLFGSIAFEVERKVYFQWCMLSMIELGFLFPQVNAVLHLYCYATGILIGFLNSPAPWLKK